MHLFYKDPADCYCQQSVLLPIASSKLIFIVNSQIYLVIALVGSL